MSRTTSGSDALEKLEGLRTALRAAAGLTAELMADPLLMRLIHVFQSMPREDRAVVVGAIERDVQARLLSRATEKVTGQAARPNPNARLYVRTHGHEAQRSDLEREEMTQATLRALRVAPLLVVPAIHEEWQAATRDALAQLDERTTAIVEQLVREVLAMLDGRGAAAAVPA